MSRTAILEVYITAPWEQKGKSERQLTLHSIERKMLGNGGAASNSFGTTGQDCLTSQQSLLLCFSFIPSFFILFLMLLDILSVFQVYIGLIVC